MSVLQRLVDTPRGPARLLLDEAADPWATVVLGHGAGGGASAPDLLALAAALPARGVSVVRVEQPWRVAGRRVATPPPVLDEGWLAAWAALDPAPPAVAGGRSAGARVACRTAAALGAAGCLALAFPLHPPGRPARSRAGELRGCVAAGVATLVVQGERDAFGRPEELPAAAAGEAYEILVVPGADHALRPPGGARGLDVLVDGVADWLVRLPGRPGNGAAPHLR